MLLRFLRNYHLSTSISSAAPILFHISVAVSWTAQILYNFVLSKNINRPMSSCGHYFLLLNFMLYEVVSQEQLSTSFWYTLIYLTSIVYSTSRYCLLQGFFSSGRQHTLIVVLPSIWCWHVSIQCRIISLYFLKIYIRVSRPL